jgi:hypothetical protein
MEEQIKNGYWRVSEVISKYAGLDNVPLNVLKKACDRGSLVHQIIDAEIQSLGCPAIPQNLQGYINSFNKWFEQYKNERIEQPARFYSDTLNITGKCDAILYLKDTTIIVDFKTSSKESPTWALQGNAYILLAQELNIQIDEMQFIHLQKNGEAANSITYPKSPNLFLKVLQMHKELFGYKPTCRSDRLN